MRIMAPISPGELIDKLTILEIKQTRIADSAKLANVQREHSALCAVAQSTVWHSAEIGNVRARLKVINETLWDIEDEIRALDAAGDFAARFVELARAVYTTNDRRAALKREIDDLLGSDIPEEKSYSHGTARRDW